MSFIIFFMAASFSARKGASAASRAGAKAADPNATASVRRRGGIFRGFPFRKV